MKHLLLTGLLMGMGAGNCFAQVRPPDPTRPTNVYRSTITQTRAYNSLPDTSNVTAAALLEPGAQVYITIYATPRWVVCMRGNSRYYVRASALGELEKEGGGALSADAPSAGNGSSSGGGTLVGPRGGLYRINSKGNKSYIKH